MEQKDWTMADIDMMPRGEVAAWLGALVAGLLGWAVLLAPFLIHLSVGN